MSALAEGRLVEFFSLFDITVLSEWMFLGVCFSICLNYFLSVLVKSHHRQFTTTIVICYGILEGGKPPCC